MPWNIITISDYYNRTQFAITLNPRPETVEFSVLDYDRRLQTLVFRNAEVGCEGRSDLVNIFKFQSYSAGL